MYARLFGQVDLSPTNPTCPRQHILDVLQADVVSLLAVQIAKDDI